MYYINAKKINKIKLLLQFSIETFVFPLPTKNIKKTNFRITSCFTRTFVPHLKGTTYIKYTWEKPAEESRYNKSMAEETAWLKRQITCLYAKVINADLKKSVLI
jgi:hypothetical protein